MKHKLRFENSNKALTGFKNILLINGESLTIAELFVQALNFFESTEKTEEELFFRFHLQTEILNASNQKYDLDFSEKDFNKIKEGLFLMGLTPEAFGKALQAFDTF